MAERPPYRLPENVVPQRYVLEIYPDLDAGTFEGRAAIEVQVKEAVHEFSLNAVNLTFGTVTLSGGGVSLEPSEMTWRTEDEQVDLKWPSRVDPGAYTLTIAYDGILGADLRGFYRTTVTGDDGQPVVIASTQCEATDARRVFPGWDEPAFKATFAITLIVDPELTALSNGPEMSTSVEPDGRRRVVFRETMPMSTYLVALAVGPFVLTKPAMVGDTPIRIAARPGFEHMTQLAETAARETLAFFQDYFGIPYPASKLDHVAIPEFAAGAMENLGLVTYREEALLADQAQSSPMEQMEIVSVIAHETAHMWFGDLVTMRWWNGIWLNEAFATFMQELATDALHPEWAVWTIFGHGRAQAMNVDGLESTRPIEYPVGPPVESWGMFDALTYEKGGAILRMLEQYLGPDVFRKGISGYLMKHRYGNTETGDLWDALEAASGQPVRSIMDSWVFQAGYPLVRAEWDSAHHRLGLTQQMFRYKGDGDSLWQVPIVLTIYRPQGTESRSVLLDSTQVTVDLPADTVSVLANHGGWGFYRTAYDSALWESLMGQWETLTDLERLSLVDDVWAGVLANLVPLSQAVSLWRRMTAERGADVWSSVARQLGSLENLSDAEGRAALAPFVRNIAAPVLAELGWEPETGEDVGRGRLRSTVVRLLGTVGEDEAVRQEAQKRFAAHVRKEALVSPDLLTAVVDVVAAAGGSAEWDIIRTQYQKAQTPQDINRYLYALADFQTPELVQKTLALYGSPDVRVQDGAYAIGRLLANRQARRIAWDYIQGNWDELTAKFPPFMQYPMVAPISRMTEEPLADQAVAWLEAHPIPEAARSISQAIEFQHVNRAFAKRIQGHVKENLA